jgi:hypothetical protein
MSWYTKSMPQIKDVKDYIKSTCKEINNIAGVNDVFIHGSYAKNIKNNNFILKDIDIIASTNFDYGDLLAIDNSKYSALRMSISDLEDEGYNPEAVAFTKKFLSYKNYNIDHWATSDDGKLLHWGAIPDSEEEWQELHTKAEQEAQRQTGLKRDQLINADEEQKSEWKLACEAFTKKYLKTSFTGWFLSNIKINNIIKIKP